MFPFRIRQAGAAARGQHWSVYNPSQITNYDFEKGLAN